jgi:hypothetical protein
MIEIILSVCCLVELTPTDWNDDASPWFKWSPNNMKEIQ